MTIRELHDQAMDILIDALRARQLKNQREALVHFAKAFELEKEAALQAVEKNVEEPTRSVLLRSAACFAVDCEKYEEAEQLAALALSGKPPKSVAKELRELLSEVFQKIDGFPNPRNTEQTQEQEEPELVTV